ncbi:MAG: hypothetical protein SV487_12090, partial [Thermodesulfobacteriota bacterium]|nr:hypothetical protein [Thermodesulfobacteriota bacterium]
VRAGLRIFLRPDKAQDSLGGCQENQAAPAPGQKLDPGVGLPLVGLEVELKPAVSPGGFRPRVRV